MRQGARALTVPPLSGGPMRPDNIEIFRVSRNRSRRSVVILFSFRNLCPAAKKQLGVDPAFGGRMFPNQSSKMSSSNRSEVVRGCPGSASARGDAEPIAQRPPDACARHHPLGARSRVLWRRRVPRRRLGLLSGALAKAWRRTRRALRTQERRLRRCVRLTSSGPP